ncbi:methyltransferase domain-containing protein [Reyranella sp.]|uniref:methyltransferase domain-containing protein n=1 Tax=Reyranella sp. TaxID=1929291 RepID=UPI003BA9A8F2
MTIDALADILKKRGCTSVCYFHADHFEPWSSSIDEQSARAVDRMAAAARSSRYTRRLSLFYNVFVPYRLKGEGPLPRGDHCVENDQVVFFARSSEQERLAARAIRPLLADGHEIHLHVHHEFWTRNDSRFDHPVSRWVNASSTDDMDARRLDLHIRLCKEAIARETGQPFERWAFIHGNWALNASDPLICHVTGEMALLARHGGYGDFSFPAGRGYCDPKLEAPFTCRPIDLARAYDDDRSDPRPVAPGSGVMRPDRFFIWNSPIKAVHSSLDYHSGANRDFLNDAERVVATWLAKSVVLGETLFIKTHAHSMRADYHFPEPGPGIPHGRPEIAAIFDALARVCDRAGIDLRFQTVNEVVSSLAQLDGGSGMRTVATAATPSAKTVAAVAEPMVPELPPTTSYEMAAELTALHRSWIDGDGARFPPDELYLAKLAGGRALEAYEIALAAAIVERYPATATRIVEIGTGWGGFAILMARLGFDVLGFEGNARRHAACQWHFDDQVGRFPVLQDRLLLAPEGLFPLAFLDDMLAADKINLCIATNITSSYSAENESAITDAAAACDELILDLARFGKSRDSQPERDELFETLRTTSFRPVERLYADDPYDYWRFRSRRIGRHNVVTAPAESRTASQPQAPGRRLGSPSRRDRLFRMAGDQQLTQCPVCHSAHVEPLWRMPATTLPEPIQVFGGYFDQIPTLQVPGILYGFDICNDCETIFLNPVPSQQKSGYRATDHYIRKMRTASEWKGYEDAYERFARWIPADATVMVDAACGVGQYLEVARRRKTHRWQRLVGLELAEKYVAHMREQGFEAHVFDIDNDDLLSVVDADSVDFIAFCEAFEHVERPLDALRKLLTALRPGGRLFFTAQRYGTDVQAAVRPGEPIYIGPRVVQDLPRQLKCRIVETTTSRMRYYIVLEK